MWCPLTICYGCFLLALTSQENKDSFSTGTNFSFQIINCIQRLWYGVGNTGVEARRGSYSSKKGGEMEKELDQKTRCSFWCCLALADSIPNTYSNGLLFFFFFALLLLPIFISLLFIFSPRWPRVMSGNFGHCAVVKGVLP